MESAKSDWTMKIDTTSKESAIQKPVRDSCVVMSNKKHDDTSIQGVHKDVFFLWKVPPGTPLKWRLTSPGTCGFSRCVFFKNQLFCFKD